MRRERSSPRRRARAPQEPAPSSEPERTDGASLEFREFYRALMAQARSEPLKAWSAVREARAALGASRSQRWALLCRLEAHCLSALGRARESSDLYAAAAALFRELGEAEEEARTTIGWVHTLGLAGRPEEALRVARRGRPLVRRDPLALARLEANLANAWQLSGQIARAAARYRIALVEFRAAGAVAKFETAVTAYNLALLLVLLDEAPNARPLLEEARDLFREAQMSLLALYAETILAALDLAQGLWDTGLPAVARLREEFAALGDERADAWLHRELALLFSSLGAVDAGLREAQAAQDGFRRLGLAADAAHGAFLCGRLLQSQGCFQESLIHLGEARAHWDSVGHTWSLHRTNLELARLLLTTGHAERALALIHPAQKYLDRRDPRGDGALCRSLSAEAHLESGRPALAVRLARQAHASALRYPAIVERPAIALVLARAFADLGRRTESLHWARRSLSALEGQLLRFGTREMRVLVSDSRERIYTRAIDLVLGLELPGAARNAADLVSRARTPILIEDLAHGAGDALDAGTRTAIVRLRTELTDPGSSGLDEARQEHLQAQFRRLESRLGRERRVPSLVRRALRDRSLSRWRRRIGDGEVVLFDQGADWRAFVVGAHGSVAHVPLPDVERALREAWIPLRLALETASRLTAPRRQAFLERTLQASLGQLERLRAALWQPLPLSRRRVIVIPYRELHHVPLEALAGPDQVVSRLPHPSLLQDRPPRRPRRALLLHGPGPGARAEAQNVAETLRASGCAVALGDERSALESQTEPLDLLHIAAHGRFARGGWTRSGIELQDGWMGFEALRREALAGALVHFASCESGLSRRLPGSDIEGWITSGLGAGARELMLTMWRVEDRASAAFSESFYERWGTGASAGECAAAARAAVRAALPHPYHWAAQAVVA